MKTLILTAVIAMMASTASAGDELWRSNGENDVWATSANNVGLSIDCSGETFAVATNFSGLRRRLYVPAFMRVTVYRNGEGIYRTPEMRVTYNRTQPPGMVGQDNAPFSNMVVRSSEMRTQDGPGGDLMRAMQRGDAIVISVREVSGDWEGVRVSTRGLSASLNRSWCDATTYGEWRRAYMN